MTTIATFNSHDATLNTLLSEDLLTATPIVSGSLSRLWSGARCNSSANGGKVFFVVNIVKQALGDDTDSQLEALIGVSSRAIATAQLGSGSSWAYSSSGQKWTTSKPEAFGVKFSAGDSIGCFLDLESETCTMSFSHNGTWLGQAYHLPKPDKRHGGLYPHVLLKGFAAEIDLTESGRSDWPAEASGYTSWMAALEEGNVSAIHHPEVQAEAEHEVLVLVGLPGSGKSTWATRYVANHPEKHYALLSVDGIIKQLKGSSLTRGKQKPADAKTQQLAEQAYEELLDHVETVPRNYVLDDSNVYEDIRTARVNKFKKAGFKTRAAVIVLPDSSLFRRQRKQHQEEGKSVPETIIADMRANFSMPEVGEVFQEVFFVEAKPPEANEIASAQADAAKAALPMLKARGPGGRQTRSRTAKATPKRASAPAKVPEEAKNAAGGSSPKRASAPAKVTEENEIQADGAELLADGAAANKPATSTRSHKSSDSAAKADSAAKPVSADSIMTTAEPAPADHEPTPIDMSVAGEMSAATDKEGQPQAGQEVPATNADHGPVGVAQEEEEAPLVATAAADNGTGKEAALSAAFAEAEVAGDEAEEAAFAEACKAGQSGVAASAKAEIAKEEAAEAAFEEAKQAQEDKEEGKLAKDAAVREHQQDQDVEPAAAVEAPAQTQAEAEQPKLEAQQELAQAEEPKQEAPRELVELMEEDQPQQQLQSASKVEEAQQSGSTEVEKAAQLAEVDQPEAAKQEAGQQARPMETATVDASVGEKTEKGAGGGDGRGVKRPPAPAVVRAAKQARTNQAAGRLVGNIRTQGTVKRTVIRGRVGARPAGMRLPPPMSSPEAMPASKEAATAAKDTGAATDKAGDKQVKTETKAVKDEDKSPNFKDVMQQLLPAEQAASKPGSKEPSSTPNGAPKGSPHGDKQQAQRASSTAKASTPKRQDQVTTKPAGLKSADKDKEKDRQERDRSHSARRDAARSHPAPRHGGRTLPPPISSRQGTAPAQGPNRHQTRDRPAPRIAALGPRDAGIQKFRGRPPSPYDRAPRHAPGRVMPPAMSRGQARNGPSPGQRPGREFPGAPHRAGPNWDRNSAPVRPSQAPTRLPPPMGRRAPAPEREPLPTRAPRDNFGGNQRVPNPRVPVRGAGPDRTAPGAGFPVGRRAGPPGARQPAAGPPHTAPRAAPGRGRVGPPAARRDNHPPLVAQGPYEPPVAPFPVDRPPPRYNDQPRYSDAVPGQRAPRAAHPARGVGSRPTPVGSRAAGGRGPPPQVFSPPGPSRQQAQHAQQHPASHRSPAAPVTLPAPRLGPIPGGPVPGLGGGEYTPRGRRDQPGSHADRPRSRSRGAPAVQRGPPYSDRPVPRGGRQPAAQQLRAAVYPQEQPVPAPYHTPDGAPVQAHPPPQYEQPMAPYAEPHSIRRGGLDRAPLNADRYAPGPAVRGPPQQWQNKPDLAGAAAPGPDYQQRAQGPPGRDSFGRQGYGDQPGSDVGADRRTDRRGRGSRDRRQQRVADRVPAPLDPPRYPGRAPQGYMEEDYAPGLAPAGYLPRDDPPPNRSHAYPVEPRGGDPSYLPPQQHAQSAPPRYDSPMPAYAPPLGPDSHQPVYGSGAAAPMQGYTSTAPPVERQPYYPPQQQGHQQGAPVQQQPYGDAPAYGREPPYSSAPSGYAGPQGGYMDTPPAAAPRGGYPQNAPVSVPRHRSDDYDPGYSGSGRSQGYASQGRPLANPPVNHGGVGHEASGPRGAPRGGNQAWAPSPRETSYGSTPDGSGGFPQSNSRQQGSYQNSPANWSGSGRHAPQDMYPPHQPTGSGQMHGPSSGYRR